MHKRFIFSAAAALLLGGSALADGMSYNYIQADVIGSQLRGGGDHSNGSGFGLNGSVEFGSTAIGFVDVGTTKYSESGADLRFTPISLGVGAHIPLGGMTDFVGTASYERVKTKASLAGVGSVNASYSGWGLGAGLRGLAGDRFDWTAGLKYRHVSDIKSIFGFSVGGHYYFTPNFAVGLDLTTQKYDKNTLDVKENIASLGFRYDFGGK
jgi:Outer membrane protein beta-barrel domain